MSEIVKRYFVGEGPEAEALIAETRRLVAESAAAEDTLAKKYGAKELAVFGGFGGRRVAGFIFDDGKHHNGFTKKHAANGAYFAPHRGTKLGKAAKADISALACFTAGDHITSRLGADRSIFSGSKMYWSVAGIYGERIVLLVPEGGEDAKVAPYQPHPMLREIKKSEFIALTEE